MASFSTNAIFAATLATAGFAAAPAMADPFDVTYQAPGVQNTTATFSYVGVENFDGQPNGYSGSLPSSFGTTGASPYQFTGTYNGIQVFNADQYGGAGGTGKYASTSGSYELDLSATKTSDQSAAPINYFGLWLSALDRGNDLSFYNGNTLVFTFNAAQVNALVAGNSAYFGNPNANFQGQDSNEPFVFLNFYDLGGTFNRVVFSENPAAGGFESDNHTVGYFLTEGGTTIPEPATIALLGTALLALPFGRRGVRR